MHSPIKPPVRQADWPEENFLALLQRIEHAQPSQDLLGASLRLRNDPVRLGQHPHLDFAIRDIKRMAVISTAGGVSVRKFYVQNFGLLGPHGALPLHYTEHACNRLHQWNDPTFSEFLDVFHHRAYLLFYRAWADAQPQVAYHRGKNNSFTRQLNALLGYDQQSMGARESLPGNFRASLAGHFSRRTKTTEGLTSMLTILTDQPVKAEPFHARWLRLTQADTPKSLGQGAMLGSQAWCAQSGILIRMGPMPFMAYQALLPGEPLQLQLKQAVHAYLGLEFDCEFRFEIHSRDIPITGLNGMARLGRTAWLGSPGWQARRSRPVTVRMKGPSG